jgi:hypothetical protein
VVQLDVEGGAQAHRTGEEPGAQEERRQEPFAERKAHDGHYRKRRDRCQSRVSPRHPDGLRHDATLVKEFGTKSEEERRYSPPRIIAATKTVIHGEPDEDRICTSYVERLNLDVRMKCRRFTRLTNDFSKVWRNHRAAVALTVAHYNLCTMHRTIRMTPATKAGLVNRPWSVGDLLAA